MSNISTDLVKELRSATGISVMQCKKALEEAGGDMEKALAILKKTSSDIALKKQGREAEDGSVLVASKGDKTILLALHCETDFVSKNEDFVNLIDSLTQMALQDGIEKMKEGSREMIDPVIQKVGEKIELGEVQEITGSTIGTYVHNGKIGVVVSLEGGDETLAKDIAMHFAAMKPEYISEKDIDESARQTVTEIFQKEVEDSDKPEDIKQKILSGKIDTYFKEKTLMKQAFIKNPDETIKGLLEKNNAKIKELKYYFI